MFSLMPGSFKHGWEPNSDDKKPDEEQAKVKLTEWFEHHGANVYWEQDQPYGRQTFSTLDISEKPDLLVTHPDHLTGAYEVKIGNDGTAIYDGAIQTVRYWRRFERGDEKYQIEGNIHTPDVFALATANAPFGRLYNDTEVKDRLKHDIHTSDGRKRGAETGQVPRREYSSSETTLRLMWRFMDRYASDEEISAESGVGALYSNLLDKPDDRLTTESHAPGICYKFPEAVPNWTVLD